MEVALLLVLFGIGLILTVWNVGWLCVIVFFDVVLAMFTAGQSRPGKTLFNPEYAKVFVRLLVGIPAMLIAIFRLGWLAH